LNTPKAWVKKKKNTPAGTKKKPKKIKNGRKKKKKKRKNYNSKPSKRKKKKKIKKTEIANQSSKPSLIFSGLWGFWFLLSFVLFASLKSWGGGRETKQASIESFSYFCGSSKQ